MVLFQGLREALAGTRLAVASADRIRLRLLRIGALVRISVRRIHLALSSACVGDRRRFGFGRHPVLRTKMVMTGRIRGSGNHSCAGGRAHEVDEGRGSGVGQDA